MQDDISVIYLPRCVQRECCYLCPCFLQLMTQTHTLHVAVIYAICYEVAVLNFICVMVADLQTESDPSSLISSAVQSPIIFPRRILFGH